MSVVTFGAFVPATYNAILEQIQQAATVVGTSIYLDPLNGLDGNTGLSPTQPVQSLAQAYALAVSGHNDTIYLIGNGATSATARLSAGFTWAKNATHLIGVCSPVLVSQRARIAPTSGVTAFANFFTVSGSGCIFQNLQWFQGFSTGTTSQICLTVTGSRNYFGNCQIAGMGDNESAQSAGSRSLKVGGSGAGENVFEDCTVGLDTITRTQANASLELYGGTPRNVFRRCLFPFQGSAAGVLGILGTGNACVDRWTMFQQCMFLNNIKSTSTGMTVLASFTTASPGGLLLHDQSVLVGIGEYGDTNGLANSYIDGLTGAAATSGIAVNPS